MRKLGIFVTSSSKSSILEKASVVGSVERSGHFQRATTQAKMPKILRG